MSVEALVNGICGYVQQRHPLVNLDHFRKLVADYIVGSFHCGSHASEIDVRLALGDLETTLVAQFSDAPGGRSLVEGLTFSLLSAKIADFVLCPSS